MRKLITTVATSSALVLGLSGCSALGINAEPYGGQCKLIGSAVFDATTAMTGLGSANFTLTGDALQKFVWGRGYNSIADWNADVEAVAPFIQIVDTSKLSGEEAATIDTLKASFAPSAMLKAEVTSDEAWYSDTYDALISVGAACEGKWE
jgi:hypothetical protein